MFVLISFRIAIETNSQFQYPTLFSYGCVSVMVDVLHSFYLNML